MSTIAVEDSRLHTSGAEKAPPVREEKKGQVRIKMEKFTIECVIQGKMILNLNES